MDKDQMLDPIEDAIEAIRNGEIIIVVDDEDRENEGDFICAAEKITPDIVNGLYFNAFTTWVFKTALKVGVDPPVQIGNPQSLLVC